MLSLLLKSTTISFVFEALELVLATPVYSPVHLLLFVLPAETERPKMKWSWRWPLTS